MRAVLPDDNQQKTRKPKIVYHWCKKSGYVIRDCRKTMKEEQGEGLDPLIQKTKPSISKAFAPCLHCQRSNDAPEKCRKQTKTVHTISTSRQYKKSRGRRKVDLLRTYIHL